MTISRGWSYKKTVKQHMRHILADMPWKTLSMTANAFDFDVKASLSAGMDAHLDKPVDPEKLYRTLAEQIVLRGGGRHKSPQK